MLINYKLEMWTNKKYAYKLQFRNVNNNKICL